ncbi:MAG: hypothetical protein SFZ03_09020 [Candidatus Melainabacteria bacterium]|nr:hypothetical protein [Candidatus Melainabacteria bacterium]
MMTQPLFLPAYSPVISSSSPYAHPGFGNIKAPKPFQHQAKNEHTPFHLTNLPVLAQLKPLNPSTEARKQPWFNTLALAANIGSTLYLLEFALERVPKWVGRYIR